MRLKVIYRCVLDIPADYSTASRGSFPSAAATMSGVIPEPSSPCAKAMGLIGKYRYHVMSNSIHAELQSAYTYVASLNMMPVGTRAQICGYDDVKISLRTEPGGVRFSGSLSQLDLQHRAMTMLDFNQIGSIIEYWLHQTHDMSLMTEVITVNIDASNHSFYVRADRDAPIDAMCLLMYWCSGNWQLSERLKAAAADLVFVGRQLGNGSKVYAAKFDLMNQEATKRYVVGLSRCRQCIFLCEYFEQIESECRHDAIKDKGDRLMNVLEEDCTELAGWNSEQLSLYLRMGRRLKNANVINRLTIWEVANKSSSFVSDSVTQLRTCIGSTADDDELARLIQVLYLEQQSGARRREDVEPLAKTAKGQLYKYYLLRFRFFEYLQGKFPEFGRTIKLYDSPGYFEHVYGLDANGLFICPKARAAAPADDDDPIDESDDKKACRRKLVELCRDLAKHDYESTFIKMASESKGIELDFTKPAGMTIYKPVSAILDLWSQGCPQPASDQQSTADVIYKAQLAHWNADVTEYIDHRVERYVGHHIAFVVDDCTHMDKLVNKLNRIPQFRVGKRKIFIHDEHVNRRFPKRQKRSMFSTRNEHIVTACDVDPIVEIYGTGKTLGDDGQSDDMLILIVPGPPANSPSSKNLEAMHYVMTNVTPKLQRPVIGKIVINAAEKKKPAFKGTKESHMLLSMQRNGPMHKNQMVYLPDSHLHLNRWNISAISWPQMMKVDKKVHDRMFPHKTGHYCRRVFGDSDDDHEPPTAEELELDDGMLVPFPHELNKELGLELIHVFAAEVVVTTTVGSGELFKAVLQKEKYGVGICKTMTHKKQVLQEMKNFAKMMNLVPLTEAPVKSPAMLKYEADAKKSLLQAVPKAAAANQPMLREPMLRPAAFSGFGRIL